MSVRRYLRPFYGWLVEKRECDRALFEYQNNQRYCWMLFENHWTRSPPKQTITAESDGKRNSRGPSAAADEACRNDPRGRLIKRDSGFTHETCTVIYTSSSSDIIILASA
ncbi:hypothetical protein QTP88_018225 [Uroleucon formosanum]